MKHTREKIKSKGTNRKWLQKNWKPPPVLNNTAWNTPQIKTTKNSHQLKVSSQGHDSSWLLFMVLIWEVFQALIFICSQAHIVTRWTFLCRTGTGTGTGSIWGVHLVGCFVVWRQKQSRLLKCCFFFNVDDGQSTKKETVSVIRTLSSQACSAELN